jgi:superfamily I DNA and/or RNA helicase
VYSTVFLDEAAHVPLYRGVFALHEGIERLILAGDPMQLPGLVSDGGGKGRLGVSMMEHMMDNGFPTTFLDTQRRGHPEIFAFSSRYIYDSKQTQVFLSFSLSLSIHSLAHSLLAPLPSFPQFLPSSLPPFLPSGKLKSEYTASIEEQSASPVLFVSVEGVEEEEKGGHSWFNKKELITTEILYRKNKKRWPNTVVIVPYKAQLAKLKNFGISAYTVDSFQGMEADCVIVSTGIDRFSLSFSLSLSAFTRSSLSCLSFLPSFLPPSPPSFLNSSHE